MLELQDINNLRKLNQIFSAPLEDLYQDGMGFIADDEEEGWDESE